MFSLAHTETVGNKDIKLGALVAVLTRNIRIEGAEYADMESESHGARVLVGNGLIDGESHSGQYTCLIEGTC